MKESFSHNREEMMDETLRSRCRAALKRWLEFASENLLRNVPGHPELAYYGTGESAHWAVQSNMNVAAALAVAGVEESDPAMMERAPNFLHWRPCSATRCGPT